MRRLIDWISRKQSESLRGNEKMDAIEDKVRSLKTTTRQQRVHELRIAEVSRVNPVYDRIKGRTQ
jgi:hypothetical protein